MGATRRKFLIIDEHVDNRFLLARTMSRKFPAAEITECGDFDAAITVASTEEIDAVITHRVDLSDGIELIGQLRRANPGVPIIMVSSYDRTREALAAGATRFLPYDEWLRIGSVTADVLATQPYAALISAVTFAIERRFIVKFSYAGEAAASRTCEVEPHLFGEDAAGKFVVRGYAVARGTRNPLRAAGWETYRLDRIKQLTVSERLFAPHPNEAAHDPHIGRVVREIDGTASGFIPRPAVK